MGIAKLNAVLQRLSNRSDTRLHASELENILNDMCGRNDLRLPDVSAAALVRATHAVAQATPQVGDDPLVACTEFIKVARRAVELLRNHADDLFSACFVADVDLRAQLIALH